MRERFDFSSISNIILKNCKRDNFRKEYFTKLFAYVLHKEGAYQTEESNISKILYGERSV